MFKLVWLIAKDPELLFPDPESFAPPEISNDIPKELCLF